jgi:hypothetical protein
MFNNYYTNYIQFAMKTQRIITNIILLSQLFQAAIYFSDCYSCFIRYR